jgi:hypothetical protein
MSNIINVIKWIVVILMVGCCSFAVVFIVPMPIRIIATTVFIIVLVAVMIYAVNCLCSDDSSDAKHECHCVIALMLWILVSPVLYDIVLNIIVKRIAL